MNRADRQTADSRQRPFSEAERTRFHNLLKLAAESPFRGERAAALAAAERLAKRHGMALDEAAAGAAAPPPARQRPVRPGPHEVRARDLGRFIHLMDSWVQRDKARRAAAMAAAYERGLDEVDRARDTIMRKPRRNGARRDPRGHARVLLQETSLPLAEICALTGLDIYEVVGMKLKMRPLTPA